MHKTLRSIGFFVVTLGLLALAPISSVAAGMPESFAPLVERLSPAVVNISTTQKIETELDETNPFKLFPPGHPLEQFNEFFEQFPMPRGGMDDATSLGSGFVIDKKGIVVTNNHVIEQADEITITFSDDSQYQAEVVGRDPRTDLAVLRILDAEKDFPHVTFGDSDKARVGDWVIAIGNPFGLGGTVTAGIISARARDINSGPYDDFIQTDAAINRGNSGGPMFNIKGEVIGINSAIFSPSGGNVGIGFSIPSSLAQPIISQLKEGKKIRRGWLGVRIQTVTEDIADSLGLDKAAGALVVEVTEDSPAEEAGLRAGDVILRFGEEPISSMRELPRIVATTEIGKRVKMVIWRDGDDEAVRVKIGELEEEKIAQSLPRFSGRKDDIPSAEKVLGMRLVPLNDSLREKYDLDEAIEGLFILKVDRGSSAAERGIRSGDVIVEAGQKPIKTVEDLEDQIRSAEKQDRGSILLLVSRNSTNLFVAIPLDD